MQKQSKQNIVKLPQLRAAMAHVPLHEMNQGFMKYYESVPITYSYTVEKTFLKVLLALIIN